MRPMTTTRPPANLAVTLLAGMILGAVVCAPFIAAYMLGGWKWLGILVAVCIIGQLVLKRSATRTPPTA